MSTSQIDSLLTTFAARRRTLSRARAIALAVTVALGSALIICLLDRYTQLPGIVRLIGLLTIIVATTIVILLTTAAERRGRRDPLDTAWHLESLDPALGERLITVVSQKAAGEQYRGSSPMLASIGRSLEADLQARPADPPLPWRRIRTALIAGGSAVGLALVALCVPSIQLPRLFARLALPLADIAPATTTQLTVDPGNANVAQGKSLRVTVDAVNPGDTPPQLHLLSSDGWTITPLWAIGGGKFGAETPTLDHSTSYFVTGGDAKSSTFAVTVLTTPALREVHATIRPPAYLHEPEVTQTLAGNTLDVPAGSNVLLSLIATEPLASATLQSGNETFVTTGSIDPATRTAAWTATVDRTLAVTLASAAGMTQTLAEPITVRVIADHAPTVRLLVPDGELRLTPVGALDSAAIAEDDHGVTDLQLHVKINDTDRPPITLLAGDASTQPADARHVERPIHLELASLALQTGDVLEASVTARDGADQTATSDAIRVVISPRAFDMNAYLRLVELQSALAIGREMQTNVQAARHDCDQNLEAVEKDGDQMLTHLPAAAAAAERMSTPLQRGVARSDSLALGDSFASWADKAEHLRANAEELADQHVRGLEAGRLAQPLDRMNDAAREVVDQLTAVVKMQQARAVQDDLLAARELEDRADKSIGEAATRLKRSAEHLREGAVAAGKAAGLDGNLVNGEMPDTNNAIAAGRDMINNAQVVNFAEVAGEWSEHLRTEASRVKSRSALAAIALEPRLAAAAAIEAVRPGADYIRAEDLILASRAADRLAAARVALPPPPDIVEAVKAYPGALRRLMAAHRAVRQPPIRNEIVRISREADAARTLMHHWAGDDDDATKPPSTQPIDAMAAAVAAAAKAQANADVKSPDAKAADKSTDPAMAPATQPTDPTAAADAAAQRLQSLRDQQAALAAKSAAAARQFDKADAQKAMQQAAADQAALAKQIAAERQADAGLTPDDTPPADDPAAAIAAARKALGALRQQNNAVKDAKDDPAKLDAAKQENADGVAAASEKLAADPGSADAKQKMDNEVAGAVRQMQQAANANDANGAQAQAGNVNNAIDQAQKALDKAEEKLADQDAMAAAQAASATAADQAAAAAGQPNQQASGTPPPGGSGTPPPGGAKPAGGAPTPPGAGPAAPSASGAAAQAGAQQGLASAQARTMSALDKAQSAAAAAAGRAQLASSPSFSPSFSLTAMMSDGFAGSGIGSATAGPGVSAAAIRPGGETPNWTRLQSRDVGNTAAADSDDAGFGPAVNAYFAALSKAK